LYRVKWVPQGFSYIHPVQEVQAAKEAVRNGFKSRDEVIAEMGYDAEAIDAEIARGNARADAAGLVFDSDARHDKVAALAAAEQPTDDETDETEGVTV
jgi:capsid protein